MLALLIRSSLCCDDLCFFRDTAARRIQFFWIKCKNDSEALVRMMQKNMMEEQQRREREEERLRQNRAAMIIQVGAMKPPPYREQAEIYHLILAFPARSPSFEIHLKNLCILSILDYEEKKIKL